ncbi:hypothetical protein GBF38_008739 [Nibea albiflora]|uniref:Uncharacterized protein n=1 Tax=Nibea albiflora TaxID=240163 RepID=A0ACB7EQK8_NIBAL|nr:hypothetical protein GBF38_008739 [Nibea albiflora]
MAEEKRPKRTLMEEVKKRKGESREDKSKCGTDFQSSSRAGLTAVGLQFNFQSVTPQTSQRRGRRLTSTTRPPDGAAEPENVNVGPTTICQCRAGRTRFRSSRISELLKGHEGRPARTVRLDERHSFQSKMLNQLRTGLKQMMMNLDHVTLESP